MFLYREERLLAHREYHTRVVSSESCKYFWHLDTCSFFSLKIGSPFTYTRMTHLSFMEPCFQGWVYLALGLQSSIERI